MNPTGLPVARELFAQWQRARGRRTGAAARPFTRGWEELLADAGLHSARERAEADADVRALERDRWVTLKPVQYRAHLLDRVTLPLEQEARWKEAFGFAPPGEAEATILRNHPWQPELSFLREGPVQLPLKDLLALDAYLAGRSGPRPVVPLKERSLAIFGDEKRLDLLLDSSVLREGRLSLRDLDCELVGEPLGWRRGPGHVAAGAPILIVENCATWDSFSRWNGRVGRYAAVVYGRGNSFIDSVARLPEVLTELGGPHPLVYFGDLDPAGLRIARRAHRAALATGLPPLEPERWCYEALLEFRTGLPAEAVPTEPLEIDEADLAWLGPLSDPVRNLFESGRRLAQEHVGWELLSRRGEMG